MGAVESQPHVAHEPHISIPYFRCVIVINRLFVLEKRRAAFLDKELQVAVFKKIFATDIDFYVQNQVSYA